MPTIQPFSEEELDREVLFVLKQHVGKKHPIGRWEFVARIFGPLAAAEHLQNDSNLADRKIRFSIARLRMQGVLVCNLGNGLGSYLAETVEEYKEFRTFYGAAAFEQLRIIESMDEAAKKEFPDLQQPRLL